MSLTSAINAVRNTLAVLGLILVILTVLIYFRGSSVMQGFDPTATQAMGTFAIKVLDSDLVSASVIKLPVAKEVSIEDVIQSMMSRADQRDIKLISRFPMHEEISALTGKSYPFVEVFAFCDSVTAAQLLKYNRDFAAHMPCRIALYEDDQGMAWLVTMDLEPFIRVARGLDPELKPEILAIKDGLLDIMAAGASGGPSGDQ